MSQQTQPTQKSLTYDGFRVMATWLLDNIHDALVAPTQEVDEKVAEAVSHIPNGLTVMSESDWAETTPADRHIYMVFPDEQVTESES